MLRHSTSTRLAKAGLIPCFHVRGAVRFFPRRACRMDQTGNRTSEPETQWVERREKYEVRDLRFKRLLSLARYWFHSHRTAKQISEGGRDLVRSHTVRPLQLDDSVAFPGLLE